VFNVLPDMILNALDSVVSEYLLAEGRKVHTLFVFTQFVVTIIHPHGCSLGTVIPNLFRLSI